MLNSPSNDGYLVPIEEYRMNMMESQLPCLMAERPGFAIGKVLKSAASVFRRFLTGTAFSPS